MKLFLMFILALGLIGCGEEDHTQITADVEVRHVSRDRWQVIYNFSEPVTGFEFVRQSASFRKGRWQETSSNFRLTLENGRESVQVLEENQREFRFLLPTDTREFSSDYRFMTPYSDGSVLLFSGHFDVRPLECGPGCSRGRFANTEYRFVPLASERVSTGFATSSRALGWSHEGEGIMVYFGNIPAIDYKGFRGIIDRGLPDWLRGDLQQSFSRYVDFYRRQLKLDLPRKPVVFVSFVEGPDGDLSRGSTVGSQMQMGFFGRNWQALTVERWRDYQKLLAHELAHLWNSNLYLPESGSPAAWMHEGGAEAFAFSAMHKTRTIDRGQFLEFHTESLNRCLIGTQHTSVTKPKESGDVANAYYCGAFIGLLTDRRSGSGLFGFWRHLFKAADLQSGVYTQDMYFDVLKEQVGESFAGRVRKSLKAKGNQSLFEELLELAGINYRTSFGPYPAWYNRYMGQRAIEALLRADCAEVGLLTVNSEDIVVTGSRRCRRLRTRLRIASVDGYDVLRDGARVYDTVRFQCLRSDYLLLQGYDDFQRVIDVEMPCASLSARSPFLELSDN